ncbi:MAG: ThuA domain-containing protein [Candidatus Hydrogenedentes bacterium]|nr:ThuA domain-containing protein [Candidatus Hydrogenedentota bacterium]
MSDLRVTIWNEGVHEQENPEVQKLYPEGLGRQIARSLEGRPGIASVRVSELDDDQQGLTDEVLANTDVMTWWGHRAHDRVTEENVNRVHQRVLDGMGLVVLHSGHHSKIFRKLMGTPCDLRWRDNEGRGEKERLWVVDPAHPIAEGIPPHFEVNPAEMYGEHFSIPAPDHLVFVSWFQGGDIFRSGCCWHRGLGKIFYFRPGHETFPVYHNETVLKVIYNGVRWARPTNTSPEVTRGNVPPFEPLD